MTSVLQKAGHSIWAESPFCLEKAHHRDHSDCCEDKNEEKAETFWNIFVKNVKLMLALLNKQRPEHMI